MAAPGLFRLFLCGALAWLAVPVAPALAEAVGKAVSISTQVTGQGGALSRGDDIHRDERIRSNASGVGAFVFADGTKLAVGPNSNVVIDQYVYSGGSTVKKLAIGATKGTLRWISGSSDHSAYSIRTPSGTLGVRGTAFDIFIGRDGVTAVTLLNGAAQFCNDRGCRNLTRRCEYIIARPGRQTTEPRGITRNIGIEVSGGQAFPFLAGERRLPRGFETGSRCAGLTAALPGPGSNGGDGASPPGGPRTPPGGGGNDGGGGTDGGNDGGNDGGGGTDGDPGGDPGDRPTPRGRGGPPDKYNPDRDNNSGLPGPGRNEGNQPID